MSYYNYIYYYYLFQGPTDRIGHLPGRRARQQGVHARHPRGKDLGVRVRVCRVRLPAQYLLTENLVNNIKSLIHPGSGLENHLS